MLSVMYSNLWQSAMAGAKSYSMLMSRVRFVESQTPIWLSLPRKIGRRKLTVLITYTESDFTKAIDSDDDYHTPLPYEIRTYELTRFSPSRGEYFTYEQLKPAHNTKQKRLLECVRTLYRKNDLSGPLQLNQLESLALPYESYKMAFTLGLLDVYKEKIEQQDITTLLRDEGRYIDLDSDGHWWIPSGQIYYSPNDNDSSAQELAEAQAHFFLPRRYQDPFGNRTVVDYDGPDDPNESRYNLLMTRTLDALGNEVHAENDYRVLQPWRVTDPNGNRSQVAFDVLGMVVGTAVMGKADENKGDLLDNEFKADLSDQDIMDFFSDPKAKADSLLGKATTRIIYDLERYRSSGQPLYAATLARETHYYDLIPPGGLKIQVSFSYSDGFGREIQKKIQAEPGPLEEGGPIVDPRWVGSGWTIFNNKGNPVRKYEPFFSPTHNFEIKIHGVSSPLFYDPVERVVATLHPNHTYEKVVFDPWQQTTYDVNDTILEEDPKKDKDVGDFFKRLNNAEYLPTWYTKRINGDIDDAEKKATEKTAKHAGTPSIAYLDTLGRTFLTIVNNGVDENGKEQNYETRVDLDIESNQRVIFDAKISDGYPKGRPVMQYDYDMLSNKIRQVSMDAGTRWMLNDIVGKPLRSWDSLNHEFNFKYDALHRPLEMMVKTGDEQPKVYERIVYGESLKDFTPPIDAKTINALGKPYQYFDTAGIVTSDEYDFKGNLLRGSRQLLAEYKEQVDWSGSPDLEDEIFISSTSYDALNRPVRLTTPNNDKIPPSIVQPTYNEANLLEKVDVNMRGEETVTSFVTNINYNEKGQRVLIEYGNGAATSYQYDPLTFWMMNLKTTRTGFPAEESKVQDLSYTYDPVGNITFIRDAAQKTIYHNNQQVEPHSNYEYNALYRLLR